jgi:hypothetical protein
MSKFQWLVPNKFGSDHICWSVPAQSGLILSAGSDRFELERTSKGWFTPLWDGSDHNFWFVPEISGIHLQRSSNHTAGPNHVFLVQTGNSGSNQPKWCELRSWFIPLISGLYRQSGSNH